MDDHDRDPQMLHAHLRELRAIAAERDAKKRVAAMRRAGNRETTFMMLVGLFLVLLNAIMLTNIGVDVVWANPVLVCLFAFSYISGFFLTVYAAIQSVQDRRRAANYAFEVRHDVEMSSKLRSLKSELKRLNEEDKKYRGGPLN